MHSEEIHPLAKDIVSSSDTQSQRNYCSVGVLFFILIFKEDDTMKLEKLPSGSYRVRKTYKGVTYTVVFDHKPTQKEVTQAMAAEMDKEPVKKTRLTFETAAQQYIDVKSNVLSPSTITGYYSVLRSLSDGFRQTLMDDMSGIIVQKEINMIAITKTPKTVRNVHGFISAVMGMFRPNMKISTTLPQKVKKEPYIPSDNDVKIILSHVKDTMFEVPILLGCFGLRRSEICALTIDDLNDCTLTINKAMVLDKNRNWIIKSTKTTASTREVIISPYLAELIRKQGFIYKGHPNSISDHLRRLELDNGLEHFSLHKLRHYFASKMSSLNIPEADIIAMGGWETAHVMKAVYRHALAEDKKKSQQLASDKLSEVIFS